MAVLDDVKTLIGIEGTDLDAKLDVIIQNASSRLLAYMPPEYTDIPQELSYVVTELSVVRFNRIGNEGMNSYSEDGESLSFTEDDIKPFKADIEAYLKTLEDNTKGVVRFI